MRISRNIYIRKGQENYLSSNLYILSCQKIPQDADRIRAHDTTTRSEICTYNIQQISHLTDYKTLFLLLIYTSILILEILSSGHRQSHLRVCITWNKSRPLSPCPEPKCARSPVEIALGTRPGAAAPLGLLQGWAGRSSAARVLQHRAHSLRLADAARPGARRPLTPIAHPTVTGWPCNTNVSLVMQFFIHILLAWNFETLW